MQRAGSAVDENQVAAQLDDLARAVAVAIGLRHARAEQGDSECVLAWIGRLHAR